MTTRLTIFILMCSASRIFAGEDGVDYLRDVKPVLRERCYACHASLKQEGGLRVDTAEFIRRGGDSGAAIVAGDAQASALLSRIHSVDASVRMPPEGKPLSADQIRVITEWIQTGAIGPDDEQPEQDPRQHWAFQKPTRPPVPSLASQPKNPIDAFLSSKRHAAGTVPLSSTDRATLLRRVYLDLIGLPPTAEQLEAFLRDEDPRAYENVVETLLASPQHGERWARHWMDVWRYSDWYGRRSVPDVMNSYPMIWRWRDWIVRSINDDKPYQQMVMEMLAADEITPTNDQNLVATGYLVRSWFKWNYETWKKDLVEHTGKAFLGLTLNCAQCHDHKYDPISQEDYFRFRAFFEPLELRHDRVPGEPDPGMFEKYDYTKSYGPIKSGMIRVFDEYLDAETFMFAKGDARLRMDGKPPVKPGVPSLFGANPIETPRQLLPLEAAYPGMKASIRAEERSKRESALEKALTDLQAMKTQAPANLPELDEQLRAAELELKAATDKAMAALRESGNPASQRILEGTQSLVLDAKTGRRALSHALPGIDAMTDGSSVSWLVHLVQDGHTNLQLGLDIAQGLTGGFVAFESGNIKTYAPGGFTETIVGRYDASKGPTTFAVSMVLDLTHDVANLTVRSLPDGAMIVDQVPAALNGWKPQANGRRGLFIDCRTGTEAVYDALTFALADGVPVLRFDFEAPEFLDGQDVVDASVPNGGAPWMATSFSVAPATSKTVSAVAMNPEVRAATAKRNAIDQQRRLPKLRLSAAESRVKACEQDLLSLNLRIAADDQRYSTGVLTEDRMAEPDVLASIHHACRVERDAAVLSAQADLASAELAIANAEVQQGSATKAGDTAAAEAAAKELQTALAARGAANTKLAAAVANAAKEPGEYTALSPKYPQWSSGRRSVLARWIASPDNPLTARVAVNHIWLRHFGQGLVDTTNDFGRNGSRPSHPELLDWLACELMDSGWSMKSIHRWIVTSDAYRQRSLVPVDSVEELATVRSNEVIDPDNKTYWRFPASRMQAEVVRDSLLAVSGELDDTMGGHEIDHREGMTSKRRSLYFAHHGEEKMEFLELFDAANPCDCYKRTTSVQPQQALALTNSELTRTLSRALAGRLKEKLAGASDSTDSAFVRMAFLQILNREPSTAELDASTTFMTEQTDRLKTLAEPLPADVNPSERARENLIHALMNHNDFVTIR